MNIKNNPWLITTLDFRILEEVEIPSHLQFVRHLMEADGTQWNTGVIPSIFPTAISNNILSTPILQRGQERLIWMPSTSGNHTVKSTYNMITNHKYSSTSLAPKEQWKNLWKLDLHGRHKMINRKILQNALPTFDLLSRFLSSLDNKCYFCQAEEESVQHIFMECSVTKMIYGTPHGMKELKIFNRQESVAGST